MIGSITTILILLGLIFLSWRRSRLIIGSKVFLYSLGFKALAVSVMVYISLNIYPGDSLSFFNLANQSTKEFGLWKVVFDFEHTGILSEQPRSRFFLGLLAPIVWLSGKSYIFTSLVFSTVSFISSIFFARTCLDHFKVEKLSVLIPILFIPSVIFWSSGILKDTLGLSAIYIIAAVTINVLYKSRVNVLEVFLALLSLVILFFLKHYLFVGAIIFVSAVLVIQVLKHIQGPIKWFIPVFLAALIVWSAKSAHSYLRPSRLPLTLYENSQIILEKSGSTTDVYLEEPSWSQLAIKSPEALILGLFRPTFFDKLPTIGLVHKIENLLLIVLTILSVILLFRYRYKVDWKIVGPALLAITILAIFISLSTPNFGSLVRYRSAYLPFFTLLIVQIPIRYWLSNND